MGKKYKQKLRQTSVTKKRGKHFDTIFDKHQERIVTRRTEIGNLQEQCGKKTTPTISYNLMMKILQSEFGNL